VQEAKWHVAQAHAVVERAATAASEKGVPVRAVACPVAACLRTNDLGPIGGDTWHGQCRGSDSRGEHGR
jgi:hypothetical protein